MSKFIQWAPRDRDDIQNEMKRMFKEFCAHS